MEWNEKKPGFNVVMLGDHESSVLKQFHNPYVVYAGSHEGCGCGFFKDGEIGEELKLVQSNYDSLANYLKALKLGGSKLEIYVCWEGDQDEEPEHKQIISLKELVSAPFEFKEKSYYEIA
ncbi:MAG: hypothetical protein ABW131_09820 [Candidatus Sedimenticola sp. 6PFRAG5]